MRRNKCISCSKPALPRPKETPIMRAILKALAACGFIVVSDGHRRMKWTDALAMLKQSGARGVVWRNNTGATKHGSRFVCYGVPGMADIIGWYTHTAGFPGAFLAIEAKRPGEKPNKQQQAFLDMVTMSDGLGLVMNSPDDVLEAFGVTPNE